MRRSLRLTVAAVAAVVVSLAAVALVLSGPGDDRGPPLGAVLDSADRRALDARPVRRGPPPPPVDPAVDLTDAPAVAAAYLTAARTVAADDGGRTHLQAAGYAAPGSPPAAVGVVVLDPPPPGRVRAATVTGLDLVATDRADLRRSYRATVATTTGPPQGPADTDVSTTYVVLARQPDGRWLVVADTPEAPEGGD